MPETVRDLFFLRIERCTHFYRVVSGNPIELNETMPERPQSLQHGIMPASPWAFNCAIDGGRF
jgi:hypothetical protein